MEDLLSDHTVETARELSPAPREASRTVATLDNLYSQMGGPAAIGRILGITTEHASAMKRRGSIPLEHWPTLIMSPLGKALGITESRLLFEHTGVATGSTAAAPTKPTEEDADQKVRWTSEDPDLILNTQPATRVYLNQFEQVVICQEAPGDDLEPYVFFQIENIPRLIEALRKVAR